MVQEGNTISITNLVQSRPRKLFSNWTAYSVFKAIENELNSLFVILF